ncbi:50S ribosomal protein L31 [[Mycoplasma] mobile]|uniref:Large ribosomal subunit protein bL31 n=1 Tax=Mycoplasma mobile (strain ATCC 43663 / 163K / NCTC 11711) TaxID=267748 RepID=RL31_MYCM1|nr:50S ribosomal protein L31 [[Mycoplasma] mobile]Q6KIG2.1 RecName: Full=Large ribosomal subunit protein bL31; AltName: Full=50S ribosomal protein L31 [Mycoplasma mobile 163K]AAT27614.1 ribosomal protein l31 [Mycoplasma mobile 163K]
MKPNIHPEYKNITLTCSTCEKKHIFGSTAKKSSVDVCSNCHPFFTGDRSIQRTTGRVDRFNRRLTKSAEK